MYQPPQFLQAACARRDWLKQAGALLCLSTLPACTQHPPLSVASHVWPGYAFLNIARDRGALQPFARLADMPSANESLHALAAGIVDGATLTLDEVLRARAGGIALTVVLVFNISAGADMLLVRDDIRTLSDLRGRRIGAERSTTGAVMLAAVLARAGLRPTQVELVESSIHEQEAAWRQQQIDAVISYDPVAWHIAQLGGKRLFDSRQLPDTIFDVLAIRSSVLHDKPQAVRQLIHAHFTTLSGLHRPGGDTKARMARYLALSPAQVDATLAQLILPDLAYNRTLLATPNGTLTAQAQKLAQLMVNNGILAEMPALTQLTSDAFLDGERA